MSALQKLGICLFDGMNGFIIIQGIQNTKFCRKWYKVWIFMILIFLKND